MFDITKNYIEDLKNLINASGVEILNNVMTKAVARFKDSYTYPASEFPANRTYSLKNALLGGANSITSVNGNITERKIKLRYAGVLLRSFTHETTERQRRYFLARAIESQQSGDKLQADIWRRMFAKGILERRRLAYLDKILGVDSVKSIFERIFKGYFGVN